jgi:hypothetical protein
VGIRSRVEAGGEDRSWRTRLGSAATPQRPTRSFRPISDRESITSSSISAIPREDQTRRIWPARRTSTDEGRQLSRRLRDRGCQAHRLDRRRRASKRHLRLAQSPSSAGAYVISPSNGRTGASPRASRARRWHRPTGGTRCERASDRKGAPFGFSAAPVVIALPRARKTSRVARERLGRRPGVARFVPFGAAK